jgi:hypothetical protein
MRVQMQSVNFPLFSLQRNKTWQCRVKGVKAKPSVENNVEKYKPILRSFGYWLIRKPRIFITRPFQARAIGRGLACFL